MPGVNDMRFAKKSKAIRENAFLPIVMLTSLDNMEAKIEGLKPERTTS